MSLAEPFPTSWPDYRGLPMRPERIIDEFQEHANDFLATYAQFRENFPDRGSAVLTMAHRDLEHLKLAYGEVSDTLGSIPDLEDLLDRAIDLVHRPVSVHAGLGDTALHETGDRDA